MQMKNLRYLFIILISSVCLACNTQGNKNEIGFNPIMVESKPWEWKKDLPWEWFETRVIDSLHNYEMQTNVELNKYGSQVEKKTDATGFYRVEKINNRWWSIDPDGYLNIQTVINSLRPGTSERNEKVFNEKFGNLDKWIEVSSDSLSYYGFTGSGSWSRDSMIIKNNRLSETQMTYTPNLNFMVAYGRIRGGIYQMAGNMGFPNQCIFAFDPQFEEFCDKHAQQIIELSKDKNMYGIFSDNELPITSKNLEGYLTLANEEDPGYKAAKKWLEENGITEEQITDSIRAEFAGYVADKYYGIVSKAIKKYAPNHMFLGSRLHGSAKNTMPIIEAAGKHCDVVSINYYGAWTPDMNLMKQWEDVAQRPFMITEFYTKAMDAGLANTTGAGYTVRTQYDKGLAYQHFCLALLESKACVGWHFFKYQDNDPTAKNVDPSNIDSNKGIVNNDYEYYQQLMPLMKQLNVNRYKLTEYFDKN